MFRNLQPGSKSTDFSFDLNINWYGRANIRQQIQRSVSRRMLSDRCDKRFELFDLRIAVPQAIWLQNDWVTLTNIFFWVVPTSIALVIVLSLILNYTALGRDMRALADNLTLARIIGIPVDRVHDLTWLLVGGLAGVAGALWGIYTFVEPLVGWLAILSVFAATVLGGMTSFSGTILGAYLVGFSENVIMQVLNHYTGLDFSFKPAIPFIIIIFVLLIRPQGLKNN